MSLHDLVAGARPNERQGSIPAIQLLVVAPQRLACRFGERGGGDRLKARQKVRARQLGKPRAHARLRSVASVSRETTQAGLTVIDLRKPSPWLAVATVGS